MPTVPMTMGEAGRIRKEFAKRKARETRTTRLSAGKPETTMLGQSGGGRGRSAKMSGWKYMAGDGARSCKCRLLSGLYEMVGVQRAKKQAMDVGVPWLRGG